MKFPDVTEYLHRKTWRITENANFNYSFSGLLSHIANKRLANYALEKMPKKCAKLHINGDFHIHNLEGGLLCGYCNGGNLEELLMKGIVTNEVHSRPAKHLDSAVDHIVNYLFMMQLEWSGAQSLSDIDVLLAPFIRKDKLSYKKVKQNIQRLVFNLNFSCRQSFQTPFTNITVNLTVPKYFKDYPIILGGQVLEETYSDYGEEVEMINKALTEVYLEKNGNGKPFTFPIPTVNITRELDLDSEIFRDVLDVCRFLGTYYFYNFIGTNIDDYSVRSMCCRLNLDLSQIAPRGYWNMPKSTGSIGVVTLNLPRLGYLARDDRELFERLDLLLNNIRELLLFKRKMIQKYQTKLMPFSTSYGFNLKNYFNTVGIIGFHEFCINYTEVGILENKKLIISILEHITKRLKEFQDMDDCMYNLEMTPAEGCSYRLALIDSKNYNHIYTSGDKVPYYNSLLIPPNVEISLIDRIKYEQEVLGYFTGGTIFRIYLGEVPNLDSLLTFTKRLVRTQIPYFDYTATFSVCPRDGTYYSGIVRKCKLCESENEVFSRVVGYYRPVRKWNRGKQEEFKNRKFYTKDSIYKIH